MSPGPNTNQALQLFLGNASDHTILEAEDEKDEAEPYHPSGRRTQQQRRLQDHLRTHSALSSDRHDPKKHNRSALADPEMRAKLESVISILSSMKNDFN
jgi:hypothetical protein